MVSVAWQPLFSLVWFLLAGEWEVLEGESLVGAQALFA